jgi:hypothetical protein
MFQAKTCSKLVEIYMVKVMVLVIKISECTYPLRFFQKFIFSIVQHHKVIFIYMFMGIFCAEFYALK